MSSPFGVTPIKKDDIPEAGVWGVHSTARSINNRKLLHEFVESGDEVWQIERDHNGKVLNNKEANSLASSLKAMAKTGEFKKYGLTAFARKNKCYITWKED